MGSAASQSSAAATMLGASTIGANLWCNGTSGGSKLVCEMKELDDFIDFEVVDVRGYPINATRLGVRMLDFRDDTLPLPVGMVSAAVGSLLLAIGTAAAHVVTSGSASTSDHWYIVLKLKMSTAANAALRRMRRQSSQSQCCLPMLSMWGSSTKYESLDKQNSKHLDEHKRIEIARALHGNKVILEFEQGGLTKRPYVRVELSRSVRSQCCKTSMKRSAKEVARIIEPWASRPYNLMSSNCQIFAREFCRQF